MDVGARIKLVKKHLGITQQEMAKDLGINTAYLSQVVSGKKNPSDMLLRLISTHFGVSESWLKTGDGEMLEPRTREEEVAALMGDLLRDEDEEFRVRLISAICKLDKDAITKLEKFARDLVGGDPKG